MRIARWRLGGRAFEQRFAVIGCTFGAVAPIGDPRPPKICEAAGEACVARRGIVAGGETVAVGAADHLGIGGFEAGAQLIAVFEAPAGNLGPDRRFARGIDQRGVAGVDAATTFEQTADILGLAQGDTRRIHGRHFEVEALHDRFDVALLLSEELDHAVDQKLVTLRIGRQLVFAIADTGGFIDRDR